MFTYICYVHTTHTILLYFPTRRSSDLVPLKAMLPLMVLGLARASTLVAGTETRARQDSPGAFASADTRDRKSTRLNSSHVEISYAVFCLKKKKLKLYTT